MVTKRLRIPLLAAVTGATLVGAIPVVMSAAPPPAAAGTFVACIDRYQNQRNVPASEPCKPDETRTPLTGQTDQSDHPDVSLEPLQAQINALVAKVAALQAQVDQNKKDQDKPDPDTSPPSYAHIDPKTGKPVNTPAKEIVPGANSSDAGLQQMPGQKGAAPKSQTVSSAGSVAHRITAPFEVADSHGNVILRVSEDAQTPNGARITIGPSGSNKYGLRIFNQSGQLVAGVGHGADGGGLVVVADGVNSVAAMSATDHAVSVFKGTKAVASIKSNADGGEMTVYNDGTPVGFLTVNGAGGGSVVVARRDGFGVFGAQDEGNGGGSACVNRVSGEGGQSKTCLGIGLPLR